MIYNSIIDAIGNTPLVRLNRITKGIEGTILAKVEYLNPGHSIKDRIAIKMITDAEKAGKLLAGGTIIEATSGNTGMGIAMVAAVKGYKCIFTLGDKISPEKIDALRAMGAKVILCPANVDADDPQSYYSVARRLSLETPNSFYPNQYHNASNVAAHYESTGPEIWQQTAGNITHYVAAIGTGGSMSGTARYLKEKKADIYSVGIDTYGSLLKKYKETGEIDESEIYPYMSEGFGEDMVPQNIDFDIIDEFIKVTDKDGAVMARKLALEEGLFAGWSSGSILYGALEYAQKHLRKEHTMVVLLPDHGTRYLNKIYRDAWMQEQGFTGHSRITAQDIIEQRRESVLHTIPKTTTIREAAASMLKRGFSQIPVVEKNKFIGRATRAQLVDSLIQNPSSGNEAVETVMDAPIPFASKSTTLDVLQAMMKKEAGAVLISDLDKRTHIITQKDVLQLATQQE